MTYINWMIRGPKIASCNCNYGCPCEFNALPTNDVCEGLEAQRIDEGWFGDVRLDGLVIGARYRWPGPVHNGHGIVQGFMSEQASETQRDALFQIMDGKQQEPTTVFNIYGSTIEKEFDPIFADIEFECDLKAQTGHFRVPGVMEMNLERSGIPLPARCIARRSSCPPVSSSETLRWQAVRLKHRGISNSRVPVSMVF